MTFDARIPNNTQDTFERTVMAMIAQDTYARTAMAMITQGTYGRTAMGRIAQDTYGRTVARFAQDTYGRTAVARITQDTYGRTASARIARDTYGRAALGSTGDRCKSFGMATTACTAGWHCHLKCTCQDAQNVYARAGHSLSLSLCTPVHGRHKS